MTIGLDETRSVFAGFVTHDIARHRRPRPLVLTE
jgi:hypothetical protein